MRRICRRGAQLVGSLRQELDQPECAAARAGSRPPRRCGRSRTLCRASVICIENDAVRSLATTRYGRDAAALRPEACALSFDARTFWVGQEDHDRSTGASGLTATACGAGLALSRKRHYQDDRPAPPEPGDRLRAPPDSVHAGGARFSDHADYEALMAGAPASNVGLEPRCSRPM